jgi:hypothetical protein
MKDRRQLELRGRVASLSNVEPIVLVLSVNCGKRMTGGGSIFTADGTRVTHGFELHCNKNDDPNNLEINWGTNPENNFHLESLDFVRCSDDPNIVPNPPSASFDTYFARGTGICNGIAAAIVWTFTDAGEPGTADTATTPSRVAAR